MNFPTFTKYIFCLFILTTTVASYGMDEQNSVLPDSVSIKMDYEKRRAEIKKYYTNGESVTRYEMFEKPEEITNDYINSLATKEMEKFFPDDKPTDLQSTTKYDNEKKNNHKETVNNDYSDYTKDQTAFSNVLSSLSDFLFDD